MSFILCLGWSTQPLNSPKTGMQLHSGLPDQKFPPLLAFARTILAGDEMACSGRLRAWRHPASVGKPRWPLSQPCSPAGRCLSWRGDRQKIQGPESSGAREAPSTCQEKGLSPSPLTGRSYQRKEASHESKTQHINLSHHLGRCLQIPASGSDTSCEFPNGRCKFTGQQVT